jgi:hypothetical protein
VREPIRVQRGKYVGAWGRAQHLDLVERRVVAVLAVVFVHGREDVDELVFRGVAASVEQRDAARIPCRWRGAAMFTEDGLVLGRSDRPDVTLGADAPDLLCEAGVDNDDDTMPCGHIPNLQVRSPNAAAPFACLE